MKYNNNLKVIHLISSLSRGGRERQLATIVSNTDIEKYPTIIIYFNDRKNTYVHEYGLKKHTIKIQARGFWNRLMELHKLIIKENPDIVYTWANFESIFILLLKPFHRFKFINGSVRHGIRSKNISHYFRTLILHLSPYIVANSHAGLKANKLKRGKVLYNGIDTKFIGKLNDKEKLVRRESLPKIASRKPVFISVANMVPYKDYFSVLIALQLVKKENYDFHYLVLGDGPLRNEIINTINQSNLTENTTLLGNVENVHDYLQMADIFIHSSKGEGCSNAILEAMAAGLPIIAADTGGTSEIVTNESGGLFAYKNIIQIKESIEFLLNNPGKRKLFGENSQRIVKEKFTIQQMMNNYYKILLEIAKH